MNQEHFQSIINKITNENKFKTSKRRRYSPKLKKEIITFIEQENISNSKAAKVFNIGSSTIDKWKANQQPSFHQIIIPTPTKQAKTKTKKSHNVDAIKINQVALIILTIVLISEVLFLHSNV
jgi:transposase-like protein